MQQSVNICYYLNRLDHNSHYGRRNYTVCRKKKLCERSRGEMLRAKVSADTNATNVMVKLLCMRNWEECLFIPKREMEIKRKYWRRVAREGSRGGRPGAV